MTLRQRHPRLCDSKHLAFVRAKPCCLCGSTRSVEAAHIRLACPARGKSITGMQEKPDDKWVTPLCRYHHQSGIASQHQLGERIFWFHIHGRDPFEIAEKLWIESGGAERALQPPQKRKLRIVKPRDREAPKRKIQGRGFPTSQPQHRATKPIERRS